MYYKRHYLLRVLDAARSTIDNKPAEYKPGATNKQATYNLIIDNCSLFVVCSDTSIHQRQQRTKLLLPVYC